MPRSALLLGQEQRRCPPAERERINKAVTEDPQVKEMGPSQMRFDGNRVFWGGFETVIGLAPDH